MLLAVDQSSELASLVLYHDDRVLALRSWAQERRGQHRFVAELEGAAAEAGLRPAAVTACAVGIGPGSFSGIRASLAACRAMAAPGRVPVHGIPSAEAAARRVLAGPCPPPRVAVVGDARREQVWVAVYATEADGRLRAVRPLGLHAPAELAGLLEPGTRVVSPDYTRLDSLLNTLEGADVVREPVYPSATEIARLAAARPAPPPGAAPPEPLYLHAAVVPPQGRS